MTEASDIILEANKTAEKVVHDAKNVGQNVLSTAEVAAENLLATAESVAHKLVEEANVSPSNAELGRLFQHHAADDLEFQRKQEATNITVEDSLAALHERMGKLPDDERTKEIFKEAFDEGMVSYFSIKGGKLKTSVLTLAVVIGSLTVIFGGIKTLLAWIGFNYMR